MPEAAVAPRPPPPPPSGLPSPPAEPGAGGSSGSPLWAPVPCASGFDGTGFAGFSESSEQASSDEGDQPEEEGDDQHDERRPPQAERGEDRGDRQADDQDRLPARVTRCCCRTCRRSLPVGPAADPAPRSRPASSGRRRTGACPARRTGSGGRACPRGARRPRPEVRWHGRSAPPSVPWLTATPIGGSQNVTSSGRRPRRARKKIDTASHWPSFARTAGSPGLGSRAGKR